MSTCLHCPQPPVPGMVNCEKHRAIATKISKQTRGNRRSKGLCVRCGQPSEDKSVCRQCLDIDACKYRENKNKGLCATCGDTPVPGEVLCIKCKTRRAQAQRKVKTEAFLAYGGFVCKCCGETEEAFLCIDHINNDGNIHRKTFRGPIYRWLKTHGYPEGFQVLCANCNMGKKMKGQCPHQTTNQSTAPQELQA